MVDSTENNRKDYSYEELWKLKFDRVMETWTESRDGKVSLVRGPENIFFVTKNKTKKALEDQ